MKRMKLQLFHDLTEVKSSVEVMVSAGSKNEISQDSIDHETNFVWLKA